MPLVSDLLRIQQTIEPFTVIAAVPNSICLEHWPEQNCFQWVRFILHRQWNLRDWLDCCASLDICSFGLLVYILRCLWRQTVSATRDRDVTNFIFAAKARVLERQSELQVVKHGVLHDILRLLTGVPSLHFG